MDVAVAAAKPLIGRQLEAYHRPIMVVSRRGLAVGAVERLASLGALGFSIALPLVSLLFYATTPPDSHHFVEALAATAVYLPLHVHHVRHGLAGRRPRGLRWTLLVMGLAIVVPVPTLGVYWLYSFHALAASVLVTTRPRFAFPALLAILVAVGVWGSHFGSALGRAEYVYLPAAVLDRAMTVFILVWLVGALRRIQALRLALAEQALEAERERVNSELTTTVGAQLEEVVRRSETVLMTGRANAAVAEAELESVVKGARLALTEARRLIGRYKIVCPEAELEKAASVLRAAGMEVHVEMPQRSTATMLDDPVRAQLRAVVGRLLADADSCAVTLRLTVSGDRLALEVLPTNATRAMA